MAKTVRDSSRTGPLGVHASGWQTCPQTRRPSARSSLVSPRGPRELKKRLDVLLVERGLAESRTQAQALVLAGRVPGYAKPGMQVDEAVELRVATLPRYVSRGGEKLVHALDAFDVDPRGLDCLDVGASTGGFTHALPPHGAARVAPGAVGGGHRPERPRAEPWGLR